MLVTLEDIPVMFVEAEGGVEGASGAFAKLESKFASLKGRRFYATSQVVDGALNYRACAAIQPGDDPASLGLESWVIPGGRYRQQKLENWTQHTDQIGAIFDELYRTEKVDYSRPSIEFYRSQKELVILVPVAG